MTQPPFHLAFPVDDLDAARAFYGGVLGCPEGRSSDHWIDFDFRGHQIVAHLSPDAVRARASAPTLAGMAALLLADSAMSTAPIIGSAADMFFTGHKWAANMLLKHLDGTLYVEGLPDDAANADILAHIRTGKERRRVVFLGERKEPQEASAPVAPRTSSAPSGDSPTCPPEAR